MRDYPATPLQQWPTWGQAIHHAQAVAMILYPDGRQERHGRLRLRKVGQSWVMFGTVGDLPKEAIR